MTTTNKPSVGFWIIAVIALLWNSLGVIAYLGQVYITDEALNIMTPEQQELLANTPAWITGVFAVGVFGGLLASILLLLRKKWAVPLFLISLLAVLINTCYSFFATNQAEVYGTLQGIVMPLIIALIAIFLYMYSKKTAANGLIN
jgi:hypothetical protein